MIAASLLVASALGVAVVLGVQNHEDHVLTAQITRTEAELRATGGRIALAVSDYGPSSSLGSF